MFETGAGGSAPKHVQQFEKENHLRWDSLGEFLALAVSLEHLGSTTNNPKAIVLSKTLDDATDKFLDNKKSPSRKVGELDNRGSHFYLAMYWAKELASQNKNTELKIQFTPVAKSLMENENRIINELKSVQGTPVNLQGYYLPNEDMVISEMRISKILKSILATI